MEYELYLGNKKYEALAGADLDISGTEVSELPAEFHVGGNLVMCGCNNIRRINGLSVAGTMYADQCRSLEEIKDLYVADWASLSECTELVTLGKIHIGSSLNLSGCVKLKKLPNVLHVPRTLDLVGCVSLNELPPNLVVGDKLAISYTSITRLPDKMLAKIVEIDHETKLHIPKSANISNIVSGLGIKFVTSNRVYDEYPAGKDCIAITLSKKR